MPELCIVKGKKGDTMLLNLLLILVIGGGSAVESKLDFVAKPTSVMIIKGTSTLHDWEMKSTNVAADATISVDGNLVTNISRFNGSLPVESLKSGKMGMDGNAYDALKSEDHPRIDFSMKQLDQIDPKTKTITALFKVTIAGVTREMIVKGVLAEINDSFLRIKGEQSLLMTDFKVEPPSFAFGTVTTGDKIVLAFDLVLAKK